MQTQEIKCKILPLTRSSHVVTVEEKKKRCSRAGRLPREQPSRRGLGLSPLGSWWVKIPKKNRIELCIMENERFGDPWWFSLGACGALGWVWSPVRTGPPARPPGGRPPPPGPSTPELPTPRTPASKGYVLSLLVRFSVGTGVGGRGRIPRDREWGCFQSQCERQLDQEVAVRRDP